MLLPSTYQVQSSIPGNTKNIKMELDKYILIFTLKQNYEVTQSHFHSQDEKKGLGLFLFFFPFSKKTNYVPSNYSIHLVINSKTTQVVYELSINHRQEVRAGLYSHYIEPFHITKKHLYGFFYLLKISQWLFFFFFFLRFGKSSK